MKTLITFDANNITGNRNRELYGENTEILNINALEFITSVRAGS